MSTKVGSLITKDVLHVFLPALVGNRLLLSFVISDSTVFWEVKGNLWTVTSLDGRIWTEINVWNSNLIWLGSRINWHTMPPWDIALFGHLDIGNLHLITGNKQLVIARRQWKRRQLVIGQTKVSVQFFGQAEFLDIVEFLVRLE